LNWKNLLVFAALILLCSLLGLVFVTVDCQRMNTPPTAPVYPNSTILNYNAMGIGRSRPIVTYYYSTFDSPDKVVAFYEKQGTCGVGDVER
jgi:hypothetical protein